MSLLIKTMTENFMTKADLKEFELNMESRFHSLDLRFDALEAKMKYGFRKLESRLVIKLGALMVTLMGIFLGGAAVLTKLP